MKNTHFQPILETPKDRLFFFYKNFIKDLSYAKINQTLLKPTDLKKTYVAIIISLYCLNNDITTIKSDTTQKIVEELKKNKLESILQPEHEKLLELLESMFWSDFFYDLRPNNKNLPKNKNIDSLRYFIHPTFQLTSIRDIANQIIDCVLNEKNFQIATISHQEISNGEKMIKSDKLLLSYSKKSKKFSLTINKEDFFDSLEELCNKHFPAKKNSERSYFSSIFDIFSSKPGANKKPTPSKSASSYDDELKPLLEQNSFLEMKY